ncbi:unnamed protein product [Alternaria alternata]
MFRPLLIATLTALAAADFTTTMDFRDWLLGEDSIGRATEHPFGFRGSLVNIDQNKTTIHAQFDQDSGDLSSKYHVANNSNSFTFTFAPDYISARMAKPDWWQTTYDSATWRQKSLEDYTTQRKQIVLTAGLEKLGAEATEATVTPTATASASPTISGPARETGGAGAVRAADIAMVCVGAAIAVGMS